MIIASFLGIVFLLVLSVCSFYYCVKISQDVCVSSGWHIFWVCVGVALNLLFAAVSGGISVYIWMV